MQELHLRARMQCCRKLRVRRHVVRQRLLQQRRLRDHRARRCLWWLGRSSRRCPASDGLGGTSYVAVAATGDVHARAAAEQRQQYLVSATCGIAGAACKTCASGQECNAAGSCVCDATSCASGCCSSGSCVTTEIVSACGSSGVRPMAVAIRRMLRCNGTSCVCDATSCPNGCCDSNKQCQTSTNSNCGTGGAACKTCGSGQECGSAGTCVCDAKSCANGCCNGSACVTYANEKNSQCGTGGATCAACSTGISCNVSGGICLGCGAPQTITESSSLFGYTPGPSDLFGATLAVAGGTMLVGDVNFFGASVGEVFALTGSGTTWSGVQPVAGEKG